MRTRAACILARLMGVLLAKPGPVQAQEGRPFASQANCTVLYQELMRGDAFEYFSDDDNKKEVFRRKRGFKATVRLQCFPVLKIDSLTVHTARAHAYVGDSTRVCAFLFRKHELVSMASAVQLDYLGRHYTGQYRVDRMHGSHLNALYAVFSEKNNYFFWDNTLHRFCYYADGQYYAWEEDSAAFILRGDSHAIKQEYSTYFK